MAVRRRAELDDDAGRVGQGLGAWGSTTSPRWRSRCGAHEAVSRRTATPSVESPGGELRFDAKVARDAARGARAAIRASSSTRARASSSSSDAVDTRSVECGVSSAGRGGRRVRVEEGVARARRRPRGPGRRRRRRRGRHSGRRIPTAGSSREGSRPFGSSRSTRAAAVRARFASLTRWVPCETTWCSVDATTNTRKMTRDETTADDRE